MDQKAEIRSYIKYRTRLNIGPKLVYDELFRFYESNAVSLRTVLRWAQKPIRRFVAKRYFESLQ